MPASCPCDPTPFSLQTTPVSLFSKSRRLSVCPPVSLSHQARLPALDALSQEVPLLCLAPRHHLTAQGVLQLQRVRHLGHDIDDRSHDLGSPSLGDRSEERRRRLEEVHHVRKPVPFASRKRERGGEKRRRFVRVRGGREVCLGTRR